MILLFFFICSLMNYSCKADKDLKHQSLSEDVFSEVYSLKTDQDKSDFLYMLWNNDQNLRQGQWSDALLKYGRESQELYALEDSLHIENSKIFKSIKTYLELYDYPDNIEVYHPLAINAFPIIIGHYHDYDNQSKLLPYLYNAYKKGNCTLEDVVWLLGEMHESRYRGKRYEMKSNRFTTEQEFIELCKALALDLPL